MVSNRIIGYVLLAIGLLFVGFSLYQSYAIFSGNLPAPVLFKTQTLDQPSKPVTTGNAYDFQQQINQEISQQISRMVPADTISRLLNLISWSIFASIMIFGGVQIASLGIKLMQ